MAHTYESIRELDDEINGYNRVMEMSIEKYMEQQPFRKLCPWGGEEIEETSIGYVCNEREACLSKRWKAETVVPISEKEGRCEKKEMCVIQYPTDLANRSNRVRVKNVCTGVLFEFPIMSNSARFLGATRKNMTFGILDKVAKVFCVGQEKFVFEYDGVERPSGYDVEEKVLDGFVEVVWGSGLRERFDSYLSVAMHLGLLIGHVKEEEDRWRDKKLAKKYTIGRKCCTLEFNGERRQMDCGKGIFSHWKGIYDRNYEGIERIMVTQSSSKKKTNMKDPLKLIIEQLRTGKKWLTREMKEAAMFVGETLENVERYKNETVYLVGGEEYIIYSTSDLTNPEDYDI